MAIWLYLLLIFAIQRAVLPMIPQLFSMLFYELNFPFVSQVTLALWKVGQHEFSAFLYTQKHLRTYTNMNDEDNSNSAAMKREYIK